MIRTILQFLLESDLPASFAALQEETGVTLNAVPSTQTLADDVIHGRWDLVLTALEGLTLPASVALEVYTHIVTELHALGEIATAKAVLSSSAGVARLRAAAASDPSGAPISAALGRLSSALNTPGGPSGGLGEAHTRSRQVLAAALQSALSSAPPSRLLTLLGAGARYEVLQHADASSYKLFAGPMGDDLGSASSLAAELDEEGFLPAERQSTIRLAKGCIPGAVAWAPGAASALATASSDGVIEVWDALNGRLAADLAYQAEPDTMLAMRNPVSALAFSPDGALIAAGDTKGSIRVWDFGAGTPVAKFKDAHSDSVSSLAFLPGNGSSPGSHILSGSLDGSARVHGLNSGNLLCELRGHSGFVTSALYGDSNGSIMVTGSVDGDLRVWDGSSGTCLGSDSLAALAGLPVSKPVPITGMAYVNGSEGMVVVAGECPILPVVQANGDPSAPGGIVSRVRILDGSDVVPNASMVGLTVSPFGVWAFGLASTGSILCFHIPTGALKQVLLVQDPTKARPLGLSLSPSRARLVTYGEESKLKIWKPIR